MSDQLNRIEKMLKSLTEKVDKVDTKVDNIETKVDKIEEDMATHSDVMSMSETLESIATSSAALEAQKVEDKAEAGYVVLESLFHGMEDRVANMILESEQRTAEFTARMIMESEQRTRTILEQVLELSKKQDERMTRLENKISSLSDITRAWIYKGNLIDKEVQELKKKMGGDLE